MIIWRGKGILIAIALAACLLLSDALTAHFFSDSKYYATHGWPKLLGFWVAAAILWALSYRRKPDESIGVEEQEPKYPFLEDEDSLFFIPARFWPIIFGVLGIIFYFVNDAE